VLGIFIVDERRAMDVRVELDLELSQWEKPGSKNAQYVVQPYYIPAKQERTYAGWIQAFLSPRIA
jgi:hypothetical protein